MALMRDWEYGESLTVTLVCFRNNGGTDVACCVLRRGILLPSIPHQRRRRRRSVPALEEETEDVLRGILCAIPSAECLRLGKLHLC